MQITLILSRIFCCGYTNLTQCSAVLCDLPLMTVYMSTEISLPSKQRQETSHYETSETKTHSAFIVLNVSCNCLVQSRVFSCDRAIFWIKNVYERNNNPVTVNMSSLHLTWRFWNFTSRSACLWASCTCYIHFDASHMYMVTCRQACRQYVISPI